VEWARRHGLILNEDKTQPILICHPRLRNRIDFNTIQKITVNDVQLPYCDTVKNLGLMMNSTLTWTHAVTQTSNRVFAAMHTLKKLQHFLPRHVKLHLVRSLVFPYFHYCSAVINDMTGVLADKLQRSQNYCMRFVYDVRRDEHITPFYIQSNTLKLTDMRTIKLLTILHTIMQTKFPEYFSDTFEFNSGRSAANTRSGSSVFRIPHHRTTTFNKSFTVTACRLWNSLPASLTSIHSRPRFVCALKKHFYERMTAMG